MFNFKITIGRTVFKKSCSTSKFAGLGAVFDKFPGFFCSKSRACQLASIPSQTKPRGLKPSRAKLNQPSLASHIIAKQSKPSKQSKAKQAKQSKASKQRKASKQSKAKQTKAKQATKPSKPKQNKQPNQANQAQA